MIPKPEKIMRKYTIVYRTCALLHHVLEKVFKERKERKMNVQGQTATCFSDIVNHAAVGSEKVYGEDIICSCDEEKENKILFVIHEQSLTGAPMVAYNYAILMKEKGWQPVILSPYDGALREKKKKNGIPVIVMPELMESCYISGIRSLFSMIVVTTAVCGSVIKRLNKTDSNVIWWIHESETVYVYNTEKLMKEMPITVSENIHVYCGGNYAQRVLAKRYPRYKTDILLYYAKDIRDINLRNDKERNSLCSTKAKRNEKKRYACVAAIETRKGQDLLLMAIEMLPDEIRTNSRFFFIGQSYDEKLQQKIIQKSKKYPEQIIYYEGLDFEKLYDFYNDIDYLICCSRDDPMPVVVAEAMSLGKPCICSHNTGSADIIECYDAGYTYSKNDSQRLAKLIVNSFGVTDERYEELSRNVRRAYEENFSKAVFEDRIMKIMNETMED